MSVFKKSKQDVTFVSKSIIISAPIFNAIVEDLDQGKKIAAIKKLRTDQQMNLRDSKDIVEKLAATKGLGGHMANFPINHDVPDLHPSPVISSVIIDMGDGPVEVDVNTLQMKILTQLGTVGLDTCADMLHVVDVIQAMNSGKKVIIEEPEEMENEENDALGS
jgi:hypothetical protein